MNKIHTEMLRQESCRLLHMQIELLEKIDGTKGLLQKPNTENKQSLDKDRVQTAIGVMQGELSKLENLDMVLALVGTMKSGKSTTNNAIVGLEVLPNRNRPMTALPTIIRHTPGQKNPVLHFAKNEQINNFLKAVVNKLNTPEGEKLLSEADQNEDLTLIAESIKSGTTIYNQYENEKGIFDFLKTLNDLVRLATAINMDFPFEEFRSPDELPVIEVEFQHLRDSQEYHGRLALLDTPGPNEEGQIALKPLMKDQLKRASGVIAVLDYTQLKSESDGEVRRELLEIAEIAQGRLSVLVNKFDQNDRHSDSESAVKSLVANELLKGIIREDDVYPVSSKYAYLANRARTELSLTGTLPDFNVNPWVVDFAKEGFGRRWEKDITDTQKVSEAIKALWEDSLFEIPLEKVIQRAHTHAALLAIDSAASKLVDSGNRINNFLGVRETALKTDATTLKNHINSLKSEKEKIDNLEITTANNIAIAGKNLKNEFNTTCENANKDLTSLIDSYFKVGSNAQQSKIAEQSKQKSLSHIFRSLLATKKQNSLKQKNTEPDFNPNTTEIKFQKRSEAKELLKKIDDSISDNYNIINEAILNTINNVQSEIQNNSASLTNTANTIIKELSSKMHEEGYNLKLSIPISSKLKIEFDSEEVLQDMIESKTERKQYRRRTKSAWGTVCGWLNTDEWGWESYSVDEEIYVIDIDKIKTSSLKNSQNHFKNVDHSIQKNIIRPTEESYAEFFINLKSIVDEIRGDLIQGLADSLRSESEQKELIKKIAELKNEYQYAEQDIEGLNSDSKSGLDMKTTRKNTEVLAEQDA